MIELVAQWIPWVYALGEIATLLGDLLLGVVGFFAYFSML
jgi:hypothetical protein